MTFPDGLTIHLDFVSEAEEAEIIAAIEATTAEPDGHRVRVDRYGPGTFRTGYTSGRVVRGPIPDFLDDICDRLLDQGLVDAGARPNAITVNKYDVGQCLDHHIDKQVAGPVITVLSLGSSAEMQMTDGRFDIVVPLPPRMLLQMRGVCRNPPWTHAILPVTAPRYSIVFRYSDAAISSSSS